MRTEIYDYIKGLSMGTFQVSNELPWSESGTVLYLKNIKRIYVDRPQISVDPIIQTLDGINLNNEVTSVRVYFTTDAKQLPGNYEQLVSDLKSAKDADTIQGQNRRECIISTTFENDLLVTELEFRFTKLS